MPRRIDLIRVTDRRRVPWKNGGGVTEEVVSEESWRVSIADLGDSPSHFSAFAGRARIFTVIGDHGVAFDIAGEHRPIAPLHPFSFDGALTPTCTPDGPTRAFNIMVDDASSAATVHPTDLHEQSMTTDPDSITIVYVHSGHIDADNRTAGPGDCLVVRNERAEIGGTATVLVAEIRDSRRRATEATA